MQYEEGQEVRVKEQLTTEMFVVKEVKKNGYLILNEFTLNKGGLTKRKPKETVIPFEDVIGIQVKMSF